MSLTNKTKYLLNLTIISVAMFGTDWAMAEGKTAQSATALMTNEQTTADNMTERRQNSSHHHDRKVCTTGAQDCDLRDKEAHTRLEHEVRDRHACRD